MKNGQLKTTLLWSLILTSSLHLLAAPTFAASKTNQKNKTYESLAHVRASMTDLPQNEELLTQINADWGPILKPEDYPALHDTLASLFSELSYAQGRLTEGSSVTINYVHIVNSTTPNAFVWTDNKTGIRIFANHLFVTTELIASMLKGSNLQEGFSRLSGIIAHELGHPMDAANAWGEGGGLVIQDHYGSEASQALEIRADIDAMRILREAAYPIDGLYSGLTHLFGKDANTKSSSVSAAASTHPHHDFRLTSAKLYLTLDRLEKGILSNVKDLTALVSDPIEFKKELTRVIPKNGRYPYVTPKTMDDVIHRLSTLIQDETLGYEFKNLEFNRLILSFDEMLLQKQKSKIALTNKEIALFDQFLRQVFSTTSAEFWQNRLNIYTPKTIRGELTKSSGESPFEKSPSHFYYIETLDAYKLPVVQNFLKDMAENQVNEERFQAEWDSNFNLELFALASLSSPDAFFAQFGEALKSIVKTFYFDPSTTSQGGSPKGHAKDDLEKLAELGLRFQSKLLQLLAPLRSDINKNPSNFGLLRLQSVEHWFPIPISNQPTTKVTQSIAQQYRQALIYAKSGRHPEVEPLITEVRSLAQSVWNLRGFYGTLEIMFRDNVLDWNFIFEILEIKPSVGKNQIQTEVVKYMKGEKTYQETPAYRDLLLVAPKINQETSTKGLETWLPWNTKNLKNSVLGQFTSKSLAKPAEPLSPSEASNAATIFKSYFIKQKKVFSREYSEKLNEASQKNFSLPEHLQAMMSAHRAFFPKKSKGDSLGERLQDEVAHWNKHIFLQAQLDLMLSSTKTKEEKRQWFNALFFENIPFTAVKEATDWFNFKKTLHAVNRYEDQLDKALSLRSVSDTGINKKIFEVYRNLFNGNTISFFIELKQMAVSQDIQDSYFYQAVDASEPYLQADLQNQALTSFSDLLKITDILKPIEHRKSIYEKSLTEGDSTEIEQLANSETVQLNSARIQRIKATLLQRAQGLKLNKNQKLQLFLNLTESGPTKETDRFFRSLYNIQSMDEKTKRQVLSYLEEGRFSSDSLRLEFAKLFIGLRINHLKENVIDRGLKVDRYVLDRLLKDLNRYTPNGSMAKDDFIESIGWDLQLRGSELDGFIEDQKSQNWRRANPMLVRVGSLLAAQISAMTFEGRLKTIEYLLDPVNNETTLFNDIFEEMKKIAYNDLLKQSPSQLTVQQQNALKERAGRIAEVLKLKAEEAIRDSSPTERIPIFEVVLTAGHGAPLHLKEWPTNITSRFLEMPKGSVEETLFTTFLEVLPKHEHAVALSYMLSLAKEEGGGGAAQLFEVFGTVGIKFGQLASIWKLFGEKVAKDAEHLKNHAKSLSRYDVMNLAFSRHHEVKPLVQEFEKILGSASIKTTTRVRFKDGTLGVLALQGRYVKEILSMNIDLGKQYLAKLKEKGVIQNSKFMMNLVEALEEQILGELDMIAETEKMKRANDILGRLNKEMKAELNGWTMKVPQAIPGKPFTKELAFYDLAQSKGFDRLEPQIKSEIGPMIVKASLKSLFQHGWFDPDRHTGNFLIDEANKTIYFLDFGQFESFSKSSNPFKADPRLVIGQFIKSLSEFDAPSVIHYARKMSRKGSELALDEQRLRARVEALFSVAKTSKDSDVKTLMVDVINEIADSGIKFDTRYIFGGLKGLIVLYGENYVSGNEFESILRTELKTLFIKKAPVMLTESIFTKKSPPRSLGYRCQKALVSH